jgi:endoglucanase
MLIRSAVVIVGALALAGADARPTAIHVNQLGFEPDSPKRAIVADAATTPLPWALLDAKGVTIAKGST